MLGTVGSKETSFIAGAEVLASGIALLDPAAVVSCVLVAAAEAPGAFASTAPECL